MRRRASLCPTDIYAGNIEFNPQVVPLLWLLHIVIDNAEFSYSLIKKKPVGELSLKAISVITMLYHEVFSTDYVFSGSKT